jgi:dihydrofolate synthase / folylpolyglutamate synthase
MDADLAMAGAAQDGGKAQRRHALARQHRADIHLGLSRIARALEALGHPERRLPPVIHVAGTNGKGSTIAFLRAMLEAGGYRVHVFTSPAIGRAEEQIQCGGETISEAALDGLVAEIDRAAPGSSATGALTPFETLTAAAFLAFSRSAADVTLLEAGMGGAGDATNVVASPALCIVTPVALDHVAQLGPDLSAIARAKAGIFKARAPAVLGRQADEAQGVFEAEAKRRGVRLIRQGTEWMAFAQGGRLVYQDEGGLLDLPPPSLAGRHQIENAGLAIASLRVLAGLGLTEEAIERGILTARWPGRLERIRSGALFAALPKGSELWLDVGHNPHAALALAEFAADRGAWDKAPLILVSALLEDKDAEGFFRAFCGLAACVLAIPIPDDARAADPRRLVRAARAAGLEAKAATSIEAVFTEIAAAAAPVRVLVCGSFGLARLVDRIDA